MYGAWERESNRSREVFRRRSKAGRGQTRLVIQPSLSMPGWWMRAIAKADKKPTEREVYTALRCGLERLPQLPLADFDWSSYNKKEGRPLILTD